MHDNPLIDLIKQQLPLDEFSFHAKNRIPDLEIFTQFDITTNEMRSDFSRLIVWVDDKNRVTNGNFQ